MKFNRHFAIQQAWGKYLADPAGAGKKYGYSQYCALFAAHARIKDVVATLHHAPGRTMLVDWAGDTLDVLDAVTGQVTRLYLFVAVLPYSGAVFCRGFTDMNIRLTGGHRYCLRGPVAGNVDIALGGQQ
ncbi:hypothetical protein [Dietzia lutea]|uniref:Uncharacterized protein n=1 Tax=Dietzia lutea TaxID=546160 RepID=A0A2S1R9I9_9ACTN|nr:hypothetical protein [Dietzia lutea]AWH92932.1 hypothetical protein A6035_12975 [Dietzia lutea]